MKPQRIFKTTRGGQQGKGTTADRTEKKMPAVSWEWKLLLVKQVFGDHTYLSCGLKHCY